MSSEPAPPAAAQRVAGLDAIRRILRTTVGLGLLLALVSWAWLGWPWCIAFLGGALIGALNLVFLAALVREIVKVGRRDPLRIGALLALKVPLVYGGLAALLIWDLAPVGAVVFGFSLVLVVIVLKAAGRALLGTGLLGGRAGDDA
jgi:hypothetical protein